MTGTFIYPVVDSAHISFVEALVFGCFRTTRRYSCVIFTLPTDLTMLYSLDQSFQYSLYNTLYKLYNIRHYINLPMPRHIMTAFIAFSRGPPLAVWLCGKLSFYFFWTLQGWRLLPYNNLCMFTVASSPAYRNHRFSAPL